MVSAAEHAGIYIYFIIPGLFQEAFALWGNVAVLLDVVVSQDDEEIFFRTAGGFQNGVYFFLDGIVFIFLTGGGDVAGQADGLKKNKAKLEQPKSHKKSKKSKRA